MTETNQSSKKNIGMAILAYIIFFIPLLTEAKNDPFVKFHVKQGLLIFLCWIIIGVIGSFLPWQLWAINQFLHLAALVLMIIGIITAAKGEEKLLPVIGKFGKQFKF